MPQEILMLIGLLAVLGLIGGATVNLLFNVGEEVGWRGFMLVETKSKGFLGGNMIVGLLHGIWQIPLLLYYGFDSGGESFLNLLTTVGFAISIAFPLAYFSMKTRSIYASATFVGVLNNISGLLFFFIVMANPYLASVKGMAGMMIMMVITYLILRYDKEFVQQYETFQY